MNKSTIILVLCSLISLAVGDFILAAPRSDSSWTFVKSAEFDNKSGQTITIESTHLSGDKFSHDIENGDIYIVEHETSDGFATFIDPITTIEVKVGYTVAIIDEPAVQWREQRKYTVEADGKIVRTE